MKTRLIRVPRPSAEDDMVDAVEPDLVDDRPILMRPDGYHWVSVDGRQTFGPFESTEAARADRDRGDESALEPGETLQEAEADLGIADWIDPDTGVPAEGLSTPHIVDD